MICIKCKKHATFDHTVFQGTTPVRVTLCTGCEAETNAQVLFSSIKGAPDKAAKHAAVDNFLKAVGK